MFSKTKLLSRLIFFVVATISLIIGCNEREITEPDYEVKDLRRPGIELTVPLDNAKDVETNTSVTIWFDKLMNPESIKDNYEFYRVVKFDTITAIAIHPTNPSVILAGKKEGGLFKSENGGDKWLWLSEDNPLLNVIDIKISFVNPSIVFVLTSEGVYKSSDTGKNWVLLSEKVYSAIALSGQSADIVFLVNESEGVIKSLDGGNTWEQKNSGLRIGRPLTDIAMARANEDLLVVTSEGDYVYLSNDGAETWTRVRNGLESRDFISAAISNTQSTEIYVAAKNGGLYRSLDEGESWESITNNLLSGTIVKDIEINPDESQNIIIGAIQGLFISNNGGETWNGPKTFEVFDGEATSNVIPNSISISQSSTNIIVACTDGGVFKSEDTGQSFLPKSSVSKENLTIVGNIVFEKWQGEQSIYAAPDSESIDTIKIAPYVIERGLTLWESNGSKGDAPINNNPEATKMIITPISPLADNWLYEIVINGTFEEDKLTMKAERGAEDIYGNSFETDFSFSFTTQKSK